MGPVLGPTPWPGQGMIARAQAAYRLQGGGARGDCGGSHPRWRWQPPQPVTAYTSMGLAAVAGRLAEELVMEHPIRSAEQLVSRDSESGHPQQIMKSWRHPPRPKRVEECSPRRRRRITVVGVPEIRAQSGQMPPRQTNVEMKECDASPYRRT